MEHGMPRTCVHCGRSFVPTHGNQRACTAECQREAANTRERERKRVIAAAKAQTRQPVLTRACAFCGKPFETTNARRLVCGDACALARRMALQAETRRANVAPRLCVRCGTPFIPTGTQRYCTKDCRHALRIAAVAPRPCAECSNVFTPSRGGQKFCTPTCKARHDRRTKRNWARQHADAKPSLPLRMPKPKTVLPTRPCSICGQDFQPTTANNVRCVNCRDVRVSRAPAHRQFTTPTGTYTDDGFWDALEAQMRKVVHEGLVPADFPFRPTRTPLVVAIPIRGGAETYGELAA